MFINRALIEYIQDLASRFPALVLTGARQSGKTTLLRKAFPDHTYCSLDLPSEAETAEKNPDEFLSRNPPPVLIDEVQYAPGLFRHLKTVIDRNRDAYGRFILTGSQHFPLMKSVSESLAGRIVWVELENLSFAEIRAGLAKEPPGWNILTARGQFPELWKRPELPRQEYMASYVATYLERDVRQLLNVTSLRDFERFLRVLAVRSANLLNKTEIAKETGISLKAVGDWISVLEASGQIVLLQPWFENLGKRVVKTPKVFFRDSGLLCFLLGLDEATLPGSALAGAVWETFVFAEMRKLGASRGGRFWYYRDQAGREVDFLYDRGGRALLMEAKLSEHPEGRDALGLKDLHSRLTEGRSSLSPGNGFIVCRTGLSFPIDKDIHAISPAELPSVF